MVKRQKEILATSTALLNSHQKILISLIQCDTKIPSTNDINAQGADTPLKLYK